MEYKNGDVLEADERFIMHGCNARARMGAGVARQVKKTFAHAYHAYVQWCKNNDADDITGKVLPVQCDDKVIINAITQKNYGHYHNSFDYGKLRRCVGDLNVFLNSFEGGIKNPKVAVPRIGCGYGCADWDKVSSILKESNSVEFIVYDYNN